MKIQIPLLALSLLISGCTKHDRQHPVTKQDCVVKIEIEESYVGESESKVTLLTVVEGIRNLELKDSGHGITFWNYFSKDNSTSELEYAMSGGWQNFGSANCVTNRSSLTWEEMINTNDYKYLTVLYKIDKDGSGDVIMGNWKRYKIDWKVNPNHH